MPAPSPADEQYLESRSRVYRFIVGVEQSVSMLLLGLLFVIVLAQVMARYVFSAPLSGSEELARFTFIWFTFAAASFVAARRKHITVQLFGGGRTGKAVAVVEVFACAVVIVVSIAMTFGGVQMIQSTFHLASPGAGIPLRFVYVSLPAGFALIAVHSALNLILALRHPSQFAGSPDMDKAGL